MTSQDEFNEYLKRPLFFPPQFKDWVSDYFATNVPKLHVSQVFGFKLYSVHSATATISVVANTAAWVIGNPTLTHLPNGFYLALFGGIIGGFIGNTNFVNVGLSVDSSTAIDTDKVGKLNMGTGGRAAVFDLSSGSGSHKLEMAIKGEGVSGSYYLVDPFLHVLRVSTGQ